MADNWRNRSEGRKCYRCVHYVPKTVFAPNSKGNEEEATSILGRCRRHSPTHEGYPVVYESDWCGDFKLNEDYA